ncbi:MAG: permease [Clostridiales bacterium]|nr:permease [Clostridiales bacterium]
MNFITYQLLGMKWLNSVIGIFLNGIFGNNFINEWYGASIQFFIYDTIKIIVLLCFLIFIISYIQSYFPPERTKKLLSRFGGIKGNILGALLGTVTPFCSCSSVPLFIGFTRAGIRTGATFSFLISSPLVDLGAFILLVSVFGFPISIVYVIVGLSLAVIGGTIIEKSGAERHIEDFVLQGDNIDIEGVEITKRDRIIYAKEQMLSTLKKVLPYILIGVGIGALIHNVIPEEWIQAVLGQDNPFSVIIASLMGAPMYADIFGTIPVAEALYAKGVGLGTILAFMMSVTTLSLPSIIMLKKVLRSKLLFMFITVTIIGIIIIGYVFNALNFLFI